MSFKDNFSGMWFQLFAVTFASFAVGFNVGGIAKEKLESEPVLLEQKAEWKKDCKAQLQKEHEKCESVPIQERCLDADGRVRNRIPTCETSLKYNKRKLEECQRKVIDQAIDERGI